MNIIADLIAKITIKNRWKSIELECNELYKELEKMQHKIKEAIEIKILQNKNAKGD